MSKTINFVLPIYKNEASLQELHKQITAVMATVKKLDYLMIFVNDGSPDNSADVLKKLVDKDAHHVLVVGLSRNFGHQAAVMAGMDHATGDAVIVMDADLQDPPKLCRDMIQKWQEGFDVVYAQRMPRKDYSWLRRKISDAYYGALARMSTVNIPRNVGEFRLMDKKVVNALGTMKEYHRFLRGLVAYAGFKQTAVMFERDPRFDEGKSSYNLKKLIQLAKDGLLGFSDSPLRVLMPIGIIDVMLSGLIGLYGVLAWLLWPHIALGGWAAVTVAIFFVGGVQLIAIGIVAEYLGRTYDEVRQRPPYIVAEELGYDKKS